MKGGPWGNRWGATIIRFPLYGTCLPIAVANRHPLGVDGQYLGNANTMNTVEVERLQHVKRLLDKKKRSWEAVILSPNGNTTSRLGGEGEHVDCLLLVKYRFSSISSSMFFHVDLAYLILIPYIDKQEFNPTCKHALLKFCLKCPSCRLLIYLRGGWMRT